ncbi:MAG: 40S ribosomal protein S23 [Watsoniomyces obsoletus]|nr:MAG: 40S ribosomal protein S23 [Watsoniomyces obsoletus]
MIGNTTIDRTRTLEEYSPTSTVSTTTSMQSARLASSTGLTITNPLVLYRSLLSTQRIEPDPSQHRLALHLQDLYHRLKDYEPQIEYATRLNEISRAIGAVERDKRKNHERSAVDHDASDGIWSSLIGKQTAAETRALTRVLTTHEAALRQDSPKGLLLHGEVGTGKSMLVDLLAECLPNRKKRRWHFNTFMLETFARLEQIRRSQEMNITTPVYGSPQLEDYSIMRIVRDMISTCPILFLDEFQLPDRASSRILSNMLTLFFQLGGVLIATSNRMPEELADASGIEFAPMSRRRGMGDGLLRQFGLRGSVDVDLDHGTSESLKFLELLRARCEVWQLEGHRDWRRQRSKEELENNVTGVTLESTSTNPETSTLVEGVSDAHHDKNGRPEKYYLSSESPINSQTSRSISWDDTVRQAVQLEEETISGISNIPWQPSTMQVYGRTVTIPRTHNGVSYWTFTELCGTSLGPADYISLASRYHTLILTDVPVLSFLQRNEARRLITLLDALYEARCRLLIRAEADPDHLFFPEKRIGTQHAVISTGESSDSNSNSGQEEEDKDSSIYSETISEIQQDLTSPFRPNISSYDSLLSSGEEDSSSGHQHRRQRNPPVNSADEDSDFSASDFMGTKTKSFTGEDERFAYKRAVSRLWELCSARWWNRYIEEESAEGGQGSCSWWRPLSQDARHWEKGLSQDGRMTSEDVTLYEAQHRKSDGGTDEVDDGRDTEMTERIVLSGNDRRDPGPPPRFSWVHAWGMMRWGRKAGKWGLGVDGFNPSSSSSSSSPEGQSSSERNVSSSSVSSISASASLSEASSSSSSSIGGRVVKVEGRGERRGEK